MAAGDEKHEDVQVEISRTVRICDDKGKPRLELTNRNGQVHFKRLGTSGTVAVEALKRGVAALDG